MECSLVFDIGTSSIKAGLFFHEKKSPIIVRVLIQQSKSDTSVGRLNPSCWHNALRQSISKLFSLSPESKKALSSVVVSGNGPTVVAVDNAREPIGDVVLWNDPDLSFRGEKSYFLSLFEKLYKELNENGSLERAKWFLPCPEYISYFLGGDAGAFIPNEKVKSLYWDKEKSDFSFCETFLPPFITSGDLMGKVSTQAELFLGIPSNVPIYAGATDYVTAILGSGVIRPGMVCDRAGTSEGINLVLPANWEGQGDFFLSSHPIAPFQNLSAILSSSGPLFEWYRNSFGFSSFDYDEMISQIYKLEPLLRPLFFPSISGKGGRQFDLGLLAGLSSTTGALEIGRSVLQSIGFEVSTIIENFKKMGAEVGQVVVCGGQAKSMTWNQMKADICGCELYLPEVIDAELLGCHLLALKGKGLYSNLVEAVTEEVAYQKVFDSNLERMKLYSELKNEYLRYSNLVSQIEI